MHPVAPSWLQACQNVGYIPTFCHVAANMCVCVCTHVHAHVLDTSFQRKSRTNISLHLVNSIIVILGQGDAEWWVYCANSKWKIHIQTTGNWISPPRRARTSVMMYICSSPVMMLGMLCYISCDLFWTWAVDFLQTHPGQVSEMLCVKKVGTLYSVLNG